jgi:hypothetical protein
LTPLIAFLIVKRLVAFFLLSTEGLHSCNWKPEVFTLDRNRRIVLAALLAGIIVVFLASCGDDEGGSRRCINCDFWTPAFSGLGRFPAASPADPRLVAFSSKRDTVGTGEFAHIWVAKMATEQDDTTRFHQITFDPSHDFKPAWSPDGQTIAFERNLTGDKWHIYVVDVSDLENPGTAEVVTNRIVGGDSVMVLPYSNYTPSWVVLGGYTWISFCNIPKGAGDFDIGIVRYPDLDSLIWISRDPSDFAVEENGVLSATFKDQQASSNGSNLIAFSSPDRRPVGDIRILASSEETPDSTEAADIWIDGKNTGQTTPHTFQYRVAGHDAQVTLELRLAGYCRGMVETLFPEPGRVNTYHLDFFHTHGTVGVRTKPVGGHFVTIGTELMKERTLTDTVSYRFYSCIEPGTTAVRTEDVYGAFCGIDTPVVVVPGETTLVDIRCGTSLASAPGRPVSSGGRPVSPAVVSIPRLMQLADRTIWLVDLGDELSVDDDVFSVVETSSQGLFGPVLSPDGKYVAYIRGEYDTWEIVVSDVSALGLGGIVTSVTIGLPGSGEDIECWRQVERISWVASGTERKIVASLSPCRGASPDQFEVWIADLTRFLD